MKHNFLIRFLLWLGFVKIGRKSCVCDFDKEKGALVYRYPEQVIWPFHVPPLWQIKYVLRGKPVVYGWKPYVFRNVPGIIKWAPGRVLPRRWGVGWLGFEFGDRG